MEMQGTKRTTGCKGRVEREMLGEMKKRRNGGREEGMGGEDGDARGKEDDGMQGKSGERNAR